MTSFLILINLYHLLVVAAKAMTAYDPELGASNLSSFIEINI
jgi:hypothetical protein